MSLKKITRSTFVPGQPGSPGFAGSPSRPGYWTTTTNQQCVYSPGDYYAATQELLRLLSLLGTSAPEGIGAVGYNGSYACTDVTTTFYVPPVPGVPGVPATPGTPSQVLHDYQLGWTGRAQSITVMTGSGKYAFRVTASSLGAVVGLTASPQESGFSDILYGFSVARGITKIMESGTEVLNLGSRPEALLEIRRTYGQIEYRVNDQLVRTRANSPVELSLGAALYSGGDEVYDPSYTPLFEGRGAAVLRPLQGYAGQGANRSGRAVLSPLTGSGLASGRGSGAGGFLPLRVLAGDRYASGTGRLLTIKAIGEQVDAPPAYSLAAGHLAPLGSGGNGQTGQIGSGAAALRTLRSMGSDRPYAQGAGAFQTLRSTVYSMQPSDEAFITGFGSLDLSLNPEASYFAVMNSQAQVIGMFTLETLENALLESIALAGFTHSLQQDVEAMLASVMRSSSLISDPAQTVLNDTWVYNLDLKGTTRYSRFDFNSFAKVGGSYYGARPDGIYRLEGPDDAGVPVQALIDFGSTSMGTMERKQLQECYVGVASNGKLVLKVVADRVAHFYTSSASSDDLKAQRFVLGRGMRASWYGMTVIDEGSSAFELESVSFNPVALSRRL